MDVTEVHAAIDLDVAARQAGTRAAVRFEAAGLEGLPALDLRQEPDRLHLDGRPLPVGAWPHVDLSGGPGAEMRVLEAGGLGAGGHLLEVDYALATPDAEGAVPIEWRDGGVRWDLWMSDLRPGRYLEMWVPAPLCHDRFALTIDLSISGTDRPHVVVTNGAVSTRAGGWRVRFPSHFTSLSPMLVVAPADEVEQRQASVAMPGRAALTVRSARHLDVEVDLAACEADVAAWLPYLASRYGPWAHGGEMTVFVWGPGRGMEYDGATTASEGALEHEVFHSWFGRGVKPARAADGWIDEAWTSWATATRRSEAPRYSAAALALDEEPVVLYPPQPWARHTPVAAYTDGARLFAGVAHLLGGAPQLRSAMAGWYRANAGQLASTDGLERHLRLVGGDDIAPLWARYVHGRG